MAYAHGPYAEAPYAAEAEAGGVVSAVASGAAVASGSFVGVDLTAPPANRGAGRSRKSKPGPKGRRIKRFLFDDDMEAQVGLDAAKEETQTATRTKKRITVRHAREEGSPIVSGILRDAVFKAAAEAVRDTGVEEVTVDLARLIGLTKDEIRAEVLAEAMKQQYEEEMILLAVI